MTIQQSEIFESEKRDKETIFEEENKEADEEAEIVDDQQPPKETDEIIAPEEAESDKVILAEE